MPNPNIIFFIGFMASGKSSLGKKVSRKVNYSFIDLDGWIELQQSQSITQIFTAQGEKAFREYERRALLELIELYKNQQVLIAAGGGTPCFFDNIDVMCQNGTVIYLKHHSTSLSQRLQLNKAKRPLIQNLTDQEMENFVRKSLEQREPFYQKADIILTGTQLHIKNLISYIKQLIEEEGIS